MHLDTNATTAFIRTQLSSLDAYIGTIGCDITKFNVHVKNLLAGLSARGEIINYLLTNLLKRYKSKSYFFVKCIERRKETYEDGQYLTLTSLMILVDNEFKLLKLKGGGNAHSQIE